MYNRKNSVIMGAKYQKSTSTTKPKLNTKIDKKQHYSSEHPMKKEGNGKSAPSLTDKLSTR